MSFEKMTDDKQIKGWSPVSCGYPLLNNSTILLVFRRLGTSSPGVKRRERSEDHRCPQSSQPRWEPYVGVLVKTSMAKNINSFEQIITRIRRLRMRRCGPTPALTIFVAYAPTSSYEEEEVEAFYMEAEKFYRGPHFLQGHCW
ncbi:hypothetical protein RB195_021051 [Necator americanus]|uniref:Uncharacterized protein n=1 Tax=Necator americanus TaxID=51031 RepID=A0ABR1E938_NECAM